MPEYPCGRVLKVGELDGSEFRRRLEGSGLRVCMGPIAARLRTRIPELIEQLRPLYRDYWLLDEGEVADFHVDMTENRRLLNGFSRTVSFVIDGRSPFDAMPVDQSLAVLEWGINLAFAMRGNYLLMLHAAVVEKGDRVMLLPAWPGHGKTTLCTALVHRGWRLFSDEFGLVQPQTLELIPVPRLMPLKNESIQVIRRFAPDAVMGPLIPNTRKGDVAHVRPPLESLERFRERASAKLVVFPRWQSKAALQLEPMPPMQAFMMLATNAFNYEILGESAFRTVAQLVRTCRCYRLIYSDLEEAVCALTDLAAADD